MFISDWYDESPDFVLTDVLLIVGTDSILCPEFCGNDFRSLTAKSVTV